MHLAPLLIARGFSLFTFLNLFYDGNSEVVLTPVGVVLGWRDWWFGWVDI